MSELTYTVKLHIRPTVGEREQLLFLSKQYADACSYVSEHIFDNGFILNFMKLQKMMYKPVREQFGLKSQFAISVMKTVTARYKTLQEQLLQKPYKYADENGQWQKIPRTLEWLQKPICFHRPQADFVRDRDYSFLQKDGNTFLSINTLGKRIKVTFDKPSNFEKFFDGSWSFGGAKLVSLNGEWYFHVSATKTVEDFQKETVKHVVGIDRGLRFLATCYDEHGETTFISGKGIATKRNKFQKVRAELQAKGTKSAKRKLKAISGRENRWMSDVNHQISKTLVQKYGKDTLFVLEDLTGVSFDDRNLSGSAKQKYELRSWSFYQLEQYLTYKAHENRSKVLKVSARYTSQRCPKCGRVHKPNRHHDTHEYICDCCGYRSNDDRVGAMNIQQLGTMWLSGDTNPRFGVRKEN